MINRHTGHLWCFFWIRNTNHAVKDSLHAVRHHCERYHLRTIHVDMSRKWCELRHIMFIWKDFTELRAVVTANEESYSIHRSQIEVWLQHQPLNSPCVAGLEGVVSHVLRTTLDEPQGRDLHHRITKHLTLVLRWPDVPGGVVG
jgi:hypothetical protein